jgi:hypothetical protein
MIRKGSSVKIRANVKMTVEMINLVLGSSR